MSGCARVSRCNHPSTDRPISVESTEVKRFGESGFQAFGVVTRRCLRVTTQISRLAEGWATTFAASSPRDVGGISSRIAFDSADCGDDRGSDDGVVTRGFAVY